MSRYHAFFHWDNGNIYLEDCNSKFGTLKKPNGALFVDIGEKLTVQCGRTVCQFSAEESWSLFSCFSGKCGKIDDSKPKRERQIAENILIPSLPSNGKHSMLIVSKKIYEKMRLKEERRRNDIKLAEDMKKLEEKSLKLYDKKTVNKSFVLKTKESYKKGKKFSGSFIKGNIARRATVFFVEDNLAKHRGDTADDINFADCN